MSGGVTHDNTRHTTRFAVIGNHLTQHKELSLLAIGLGYHIQSLPTGSPVDIKSLAARFPEGATRISAALRELETHGYLRRERHRTPAGRIATRTVSCNQPKAPRPHHSKPARPTQAHPEAPEAPAPEKPREPRRKHPLPPVPQPGYPAPSLLQQATDLLATLHRESSSLLLSTCDTAHLAPGVAAWLERDVTPAAVRRALTTNLPPEGLRRPAALLAHRLMTHLPPPPPLRAEPKPHYRIRNCDGCDRGFRAPESEDRCHDCRAAAAARS